MTRKDLDAYLDKNVIIELNDGTQVFGTLCKTSGMTIAPANCYFCCHETVYDATILFRASHVKKIKESENIA